MVVRLVLNFCFRDIFLGGGVGGKRCPSKKNVCLANVFKEFPLRTNFDGTTVVCDNQHCVGEGVVHENLVLSTELIK